MPDQIDELEKLCPFSNTHKYSKIWKVNCCDYCQILHTEEYKAYALEQSRKAVVETEKAFGGCKKCYGKGYATVRSGIRGFDDFGGEGFVGAIKTNMKFCTCDRGKQLAQITKQEL